MNVLLSPFPVSISAVTKYSRQIQRQRNVVSNILSRLESGDTLQEQTANNSLPILAPPQLPHYVITFLGNFYTTIFTSHLEYLFYFLLLKVSSYLNVELRCKWSFFSISNKICSLPPTVVAPRQSNVDLWTKCEHHVQSWDCPSSICQRFTANYWNFVTPHVSVGYFIAGWGFIGDTSTLATLTSLLMGWEWSRIEQLPQYFYFTLLRILFLTQALVSLSLVVHLWHREYSLQDDLLSCEGLPRVGEMETTKLFNQTRNFYSRQHKSVHCS